MDDPCCRDLILRQGSHSYSAVTFNGSWSEPGKDFQLKIQLLYNPSYGPVTVLWTCIPDRAPGPGEQKNQLHIFLLSSLTAAGMAGDTKGYRLFGKGHHSKWEKLLENLSGLAVLCRLHRSQGDSTANTLEGSISVGAVPSPTRTTAHRAPLPSHNEKCMPCCVVFMQRSPSFTFRKI